MTIGFPIRICSIYKITNTINEKLYIGQTWNTLEYRFKQHWYKKKNISKIHNSITKYGRNNFQIELLAETDNQQDADCYEKYFIANLETIEYGYNISEGGSRGRRGRHSDETKKKIGAASKLRIPSDETRQKMSISRTGKIASDDTKKKMSESKSGFMKGKKLSNEIKLKISISLIGRKFSDETKQKQSGELNHNSKLTNIQRLEIHSDIRSYAIIAKEYKISTTTVCRIKKKVI